MPFTLFHLGPGAVFKAIGGRHFSFMVFGGSQVLIDIEPLVRMELGTPILHGYSHTIVGAIAIGALSTVTGKPISEFVLRWRKIPHAPISWQAAGMGAFIGTLSHVVLDAIVHADVQPWWPIASANQFLGLMGYADMEWWCVALGVVGAVGVALRFAKQGRT